MTLKILQHTPRTYQNDPHHQQIREATRISFGSESGWGRFQPGYAPGLRKKRGPFVCARNLGIVCGVVGLPTHIQSWQIFWVYRHREKTHVCLRAPGKNHYPGIKSPFAGDILYVYIHVYR